MSVAVGIHLDRPGTRFARGQSVTGHVTLRADAPVTCEVPMHLEWHAHGEGDPASEALASGSLFRGSLACGEEKNLPFSFPVPSDVETYDGTTFRVELRVRALALLVGEATSPHEEAVAPIRVAPKSPPSAVRVAPVSETVHTGSVSTLVKSLGVVALGALTTALGVAVPAVGFLSLLGVGAVLLGSVVALLVGRRAAAERRTGAIGVAIAQDGEAGYRDVPGSSPLRATVTTRAKNAVVTVRLRVIEEATARYGSGDSYTHSTILHDETVELAADPSGAFCGRVPLPAPGAVPLPLRRGHNRITWDLFTTVAAPGAPEALQHHELHVSAA